MKLIKTQTISTSATPRTVTLNGGQTTKAFTKMVVRKYQDGRRVRSRTTHELA